MNPDQKTRLLIGTLAAAVILAVGFGLYQELGRSSIPVVQPIAQATILGSTPIPEPVPGMPLLRIQADNPVTVNTGGHQASVTGDSGLSYEWSIQGGTLEGSTSSASATWTAGAGAETVLTCKGTNAADKSSSVTLRVVLRQPSTISRFEAVPLVITEGSSAKLSWTANNVQKLVLEPGGQDVSKNTSPAIDVKPGKTTTYTLSATNSTGVTTSRELQLKVVPAPEMTSLRAEPVTGKTTTFIVIAEFKAGKAVLKNGSQVVTSSETSPLHIQVADLKEGSVLALTVTNEAGTYLASTLSFSAPKK